MQIENYRLSISPTLTDRSYKNQSRTLLFVQGNFHQQETKKKKKKPHLIAKHYARTDRFPTKIL